MTSDYHVLLCSVWFPLFCFISTFSSILYDNQITFVSHMIFVKSVFSSSFVLFILSHASNHEGYLDYSTMVLEFYSSAMLLLLML